MKKVITTVWACIALNITVFAQERVPKEMQFAIGGTYLLKQKNATFTSIYPTGARFVFNYGWQVSHLDRPYGSWIFIPLEVSYFPQDEKWWILHYGWAIRHDIKIKNSLLFLSYYLLLNNMHIIGFDGGDMGHETRFTIGFLSPSFIIELGWATVRFPAIGGPPLRQQRLILQMGYRIYKPLKQ